MPDFTELKLPISFVAIFTLLGCLFGLGLGYLMGSFNPAYYRALFPNVSPQRLDEVAVGIGLGATQGTAAGFVAGTILAITSMLIRGRRETD
ncbi:hypothetical protein NHH03_27285 [Stieleria sp. TO1_6]|uniref:hypothetical protein n=1 Tax=Stieleria tagensis TaxID=2956795 RepID=UPI00209B4C0A|nr:hypothetical protein [Stieleria tagensis]MCO8125473.1 hypothetical protein [Stieleria tagensis]